MVIEGKEMNIGCFHAKAVVNCGILNIEMHKFLSYQVHIFGNIFHMGLFH